MDLSRYAYLDGLRGLAALQVLLGHCVAAFFPSYVRPLGFLVDGDFGVLLFFVMSGFVLTFSFERTPFAIAESALGRVIRLLLPLAAATTAAFLVLSLLPHWYLRAADLSGSAWLESKQVGGALRAAADMTGLSLLTGCSNTTLFHVLAPYLPPIESSPDGPTWSLHIELWGSMLVQLLVLTRAQTVTAYYAVAAISVMLIGGNALILFLIGHACALLVRSTAVESLKNHRLAPLIATLALLAGLLIAEHGDLPGFYTLARLSMLTSVLEPYAWFQWNKEIAAILVFSGVLMLAPLQAKLGAKPLLWLGRTSFAIYLLHVPILMSVGSLTYIFAARFGAALAGLAAIGVVSVASLLLGHAFERLVDRPAIKLSRAVRRKPPMPAVASELGV